MFLLFEDTIYHICTALLLLVYHTFDIFRMMLQIIVYGDHKITAAVIEPTEQGSVLSEISGKIYSDYFTRILIFEFFYHVPAFVLAEVVDQYDFNGHCNLFEVFYHPHADLLDGLFAVIDGNNDRVQWL
jgi:hypothetical protein